MRLRFAKRAVSRCKKDRQQGVRLLVSSLPIEFLIITIGVCRLLNIESGVLGRTPRFPQADPLFSGWLL
jgi:hypothetical protein